MQRKREPNDVLDELRELEEIDEALHAPAMRMDLTEFAAKFGRRVQGSLWYRVDKMTVADLVRLKEVEVETEKSAENRRPTELRVVWIDKTSEITT